MTWCDLEQAAPEIARLGRERLDQARVALLGTVRADGSPRISPVEPYLSQGKLLFGAMSWSSKVRDLLRDARCALHSAVTDPDSGEGELKLYGRAIEADDPVRNSCRQGWWRGQRPDAAAVFVLNIEQASFISWDIQRGQMIARQWSRKRGYRETRRAYP
jgi:hypothetical protein